MKKNQVSKDDLKEEIRRQLKTEDFSEVKETRLERNGIITFIPKK